MTAELQAMIERLPGLPGVYFFYTQHDDLVYIGKSIHIRKRVQQHFQGKDSKTRSACFHYQIKSCYGACIDQEPPESYNQRVDTFLHAHRFERFTKLFEVEGRSSAEKGLVYIERGIYRGFGFLDAPYKSGC